MVTNGAIVPPIIIAEGSDLHFYDRVADAEAAVETYDVVDEILTGYDSKGGLLALLVKDNRTQILASGDRDEEGLISLLQEILNESGVKDPETDLEILIKRARRHFSSGSA